MNRRMELLQRSLGRIEGAALGAPEHICQEIQDALDQVDFCIGYILKHVVFEEQTVETEQPNGLCEL